MGRTIKVLGVTYDRNDATNFYRGAWAFDVLARKHDDIKVMFTPKGVRPDTIDLRSYDIIYFERVSVEEEVQLVIKAKYCGCKVWVDFDDDLTSIPRDNPCYATALKQNLRKHFAQACALADIVTTSTDHLNTVCKQFAKNVFTIPNSFDVAHFGAPDFEDIRDRPPLLMWRGTNTHMRDILSVRGGLSSFATEHPDWKFLFMGHDPWYLDLPADRHFVDLEFSPILEYLARAKSYKPALMVIPLIDDPLNRSKSNIAAIEATWLGAVCITPDLPEFTRISQVTYDVNKPETIRERLYTLANNRAAWPELVKRQWRSIIENYDMAEVNKLREQLIRKLA